MRPDVEVLQGRDVKWRFAVTDKDSPHELVTARFIAVYHSAPEPHYGS
jgi:hypothetical protein